MPHTIEISKLTPEFYVVEEKLVLAVNAMLRRAYAEMCYQEAMAISHYDGALPLVKPYHTLIKSYSTNNGMMGTIAFTSGRAKGDK